MAAEISYTNMGFEGAGPWAYRKLSESELSEELARLANAQKIHGADVVCKPSDTFFEFAILTFYTDD